MPTTHHMVVELLRHQADKKRKDAADLIEAAEVMETGLAALLLQQCPKCYGLGYVETHSNRTERIGPKVTSRMPCGDCDGSGFNLPKNL